MKTIYISGPITGLPGENKPAFAAMHQRIIDAGHIPVNPHVICANIPAGSPHAEFMRVCIAHLATTDAIIMLPGWDESKGARAEYIAASWCGLEILEEI